MLITTSGWQARHQHRRLCERCHPSQGSRSRVCCGAQVKDCLEESRTKPGFGSACREEIEGMMERRVRDFRLDSRLRTTCEQDIFTMCAFFGVSGARWLPRGPTGGGGGAP